MIRTTTNATIRGLLAAFAVLALLNLALPAGAAARVYLSGPGLTEGDPTDTHDLGDGTGTGGGGGTDDDIHDTLSTSGDDPVPAGIFELVGLRVLVVPSASSALGFDLVFVPVATEDAYAR